MDTRQINRSLKRVKGFQGTFPCNHIPNLPRNGLKTTIYFVLNTARYIRKKDKNHSKSKTVAGKHWVVLVIHPSHKAEYYDSFGLPPEQHDIREYITNNCANGCTYNTQMTQNPLSRTCGVHCIDFIISRSSGISLRDYVTDFRTNLIENDQLVVKRVHEYLSNMKLNLNVYRLLV